MRRSIVAPQVVDFDNLIVEFLKLFQAVPEYKYLWKPKHHFLTHIPIDIMSAAAHAAPANLFPTTSSLTVR